MLVKHNRDGLHHVNGLVFLPGVNEVDEKAFDAACKLPAFKALVDDGTFEPVQTKSGKAVSVGDVTKLPEKDAIALVTETINSELLNGWKSDTRPAVLEAIAAQLVAIDPTAKPA
jgi:hypothetical protein